MTDIGKMYAKIAKENRPNCATSEYGQTDPTLERMLALAMIQNRRRNIRNSNAKVKTKSGNLKLHRTFVFNSRFCDADTGKPYPQIKKDFCPIRVKKENVPENNFFEENKQLIQKTMQAGDRAFVKDGTIYLISGATWRLESIHSDPSLNLKANLSLPITKKPLSMVGVFIDSLQIKKV